MFASGLHVKTKMNENTKNSPEEGSISSPDTQSKVALPENDSYQHSLYIAAISKYIGAEGLHSPAIDLKEERNYVFDFYHPESGCFFKILKGFDRAKYNEYLCHPDDPYLIVDLNDTGAAVEECECCGDIYLSVPAGISKQIYSDAFTYVYYDGDLWEFGGHRGNEGVWSPCLPKVLRDYFDDDDE